MMWYLIIAVLLGLGWFAVGRPLFAHTAGGVVDLTSAYPKGEESLVCLDFGPASCSGAKGTADYVLDIREAPFAFQPIKAELSAQTIAEGAAITINLEDDTATAQEIISDWGVTAVAAGDIAAPQSPTVDTTLTIKKEAYLLFSVVSNNSSDVLADLHLRLWVRPIY